MKPTLTTLHSGKTSLAEKKGFAQNKGKKTPHYEKKKNSSQQNDKLRASTEKKKVTTTLALAITATKPPTATTTRQDAPWAKVTKNVKKPPGEKGQTIIKSNMLHGPKVRFLIFLIFVLFHLGIR